MEVLLPGLLQQYRNSLPLFFCYLCCSGTASTLHDNLLSLHSSCVLFCISSIVKKLLICRAIASHALAAPIIISLFGSQPAQRPHRTFRQPLASPFSLLHSLFRIRYSYTMRAYPSVVVLHGSSADAPSRIYPSTLLACLLPFDTSSNMLGVQSSCPIVDLCARDADADETGLKQVLRNIRNLRLKSSAVVQLIDRVHPTHIRLCQYL